MIPEMRHSKRIILIRILLLLFLLHLCSPYDLYSEGIFNAGKLPGSAGDIRGNESIPNIPLTVDTNRFSDGISSNSSFDTTAAHFPKYPDNHNSIPDDRWLHYVNYMESAKEQGIAGYGEGDARREDARIVLITQYYNASTDELVLPPAPQKTFPVYASIKWNPSDFAIQEGEHYNITVYDTAGGAEQFWQDGGIRVNSQGYESFYDAISNCYVGLGRCRSHLKKRRRLQTANWMSVACAIGQFVRPLQIIKPGEESTATYLPLDESTLQQTIFPVGNHVSFRATYTGQLMCFANDAHTEYWNNIGFLNVTVQRTSWPPLNATYYTNLYMPACDSALAVYNNYIFNGTKVIFKENMKCNPDGGGSGWKLVDILSDSARYSSGAPASLQH